MAYLLALLYLACIYLRPAEIIPGWEAFPFVEVVAALAVLCMVGSLVLRPRRFWDLPQDWFVIGFLVAVAASNAAWGWMSGALDGTFAIAPAIFCYFLLRSAIESYRQLRWAAYTLVALTVWHAVNGVVEFHTGFGVGGVVPVETHSFSVDDEEPGARVRRIRATGIFNDPNDLALTLVIAVPFLAGPLLRRTTPLPVRMVAFILLIPVVVALYYTNSRGGMLGLAAALVPYGYRRFGKWAGPLVAAAAMAALLVLGPSRMANLDASESSAQNRVQSWAEGLQMFKSRPLFGVGFGRYTEYNELVAHNSFVHTLSELGLFGSFCFVGMGYWFYQNSRGPTERDAERWGEDLWQSGLALAVCAMFLSRQYNVQLFIWLALSGAYVRVMAGPMVPPPRPAVHMARIAAITAVGVICTYTRRASLGDLVDLKGHADMSSKPVTVALIGCGQIADAHLQELRRIRTASVAAVCDVHLDVARQAAMRFAVPRATDDVQRMLDEVRPDVVHITTPPHTHHALALQCLAAGTHVYVEKPFTVDSGEAEEIIATADKRGLRVCLGHDQLFDPAWQECHRRVSSGDAGEVVHVEALQGYDLTGPFGRLLQDDTTHWIHRLPGRLFQNVMSHALVRILDLMPDERPAVSARWFASDVRASFPTELRVSLFGAACTGALTFSSRVRPTRRITRVFGTRCVLDVDLDARAVTSDVAAVLPGALGKTELAWRRLVQSRRHLATILGRLSRCDLHYFEGMHVLFERFYEAVTTGGAMPVPHADALRTTRVMDAVFESCRQAESVGDARRVAFTGSAA